MQDTTGTPVRRELSDRSKAILASLRRARARSHPSVLETLCWFAGVALIAFYCAAQAAGEWERRRAVEDFLAASVTTESAPAAVAPASGANAPSVTASATVAVAESAALAALRADVPYSSPRDAAVGAGTRTLPVALLRIPGAELEVPVFPDTSERNLNRGAGWIAGTAGPDAGGNFAIAAHRDQHFKVLEGVALGDVIEVQSRRHVRRYAVTRIDVVEPEDVSVLRATPTPSITLVTCYPFRYVGPAPRRYVVRATALNDELDVAGQAGLSGPNASHPVMDDHSYKHH